MCYAAGKLLIISWPLTRAMMMMTMMMMDLMLDAVANRAIRFLAVQVEQNPTFSAFLRVLAVDFVQIFRSHTWKQVLRPFHSSIFLEYLASGFQRVFLTEDDCTLMSDPIQWLMVECKVDG